MIRNPEISRHLKGKHAAFRRAVVGAYRVIYRVEGDTLRIYLVQVSGNGDAISQATNGLP